MKKACVELFKVWFEPWDKRDAKKLERGEFQFHIRVSSDSGVDNSIGHRIVGASFIDARGRHWDLLDLDDGIHVDIDSSSEAIIIFGFQSLIDEPQDLIEHSTLKIWLAPCSADSVLIIDIYHNGTMGDLTWNTTITNREAHHAR